MAACAPAATWTRDAAIAPALARVDRDHDGRLSQAEYDKVAWRGPAFATADADHDGALGLAEVDALMTSQDPVTFLDVSVVKVPEGPRGALPPDGALLPEPPGSRGVPPGVSGGPSPAVPPQPPQPPQPQPGGVEKGGGPEEGGGPENEAMPPGETWLVLMLLREEVLAQDPGAEVPTREEIFAAEGAYDAPAVRQLLLTLQSAATRAGLAFPPSLSQAP